jgi:hypothetical protein
MKHVKDRAIIPAIGDLDPMRLSPLSCVVVRGASTKWS